MIIIFFILSIVIFIFGYKFGSDHALNTTADVLHDISSKLSPEAKVEFDKIIEVVLKGE